MSPEDISAIVLCGGGGRRLGGVDKPLLRVGGKALVEFVIDRLRPQASRIVLSIGREPAPYQGFGCELVRDREPDQGPLGGLVSCFAELAGPWLLTCPGDAPWTAPNLAASLSMDAREHGVAVAHDGKRRQNLTMLLHRARADSLMGFYADGGRAVHRWLDAEGIPSTPLPELAESFVNINTPADLESLRWSPGSH